MVNNPLRGRKLYREAFDADRDFLIILPIKASGIDFACNDIFNKKLVTTRRLRQLYDSKRIDMLPYSDASEADSVNGEKVEKIDFGQLPDESIRHWLESNGVIVRLNTKRPKLIARAEQQWEKLYVDEAKPQLEATA